MIEVPPISGPDAATDWAEMSCLFGRRPSISRPEVENALEEANVDNLELTVEDIWREIAWRHSIVPKCHPIVTLEGRLQRVRTWRSTFSYTFMLLLSCHYFYQSTKIPRSQWTRTAKLFECLTTVALKRYSGQAINIGAPRGEGVPKSFMKCLDFISSNTKEPRGPISKFRAWTKDEGVDIIAWHPFDERCGQAIILAQCAAGTDWREKTMEISLPVWREYIDFATDPLRALVFPSVCHDEWMYLSKKGGILLDRLRITSLIPMNMASNLRKELEEWSEKQLEGLQRAT